MVIVPSVDVRGGRVAYRGGAGADEDPVALATRYVADGAAELHLVDLDGAERGEYANASLLSRIARSVGVACRLAGGISSLAKAQAALDAGFSGVLFSSAVLADEELLGDIAGLGRSSIVEIEARDGALAPRGGDPALVARASGLDARRAAEIAVLRGVRSLYVVDTSADGRLGGPPLALLEQLRATVGRDIAFHTGGGVRDVDDVRALAHWGAASVVIGRAFLERRFTLADAMAACA